jgi:hypothetical protein
MIIQELEFGMLVKSTIPMNAHGLCSKADVKIRKGGEEMIILRSL